MDSILNYISKPEDDYYEIVGCDELSTTDQVCAEYKARALECHPDKHPGDPQAAEKFAKLQVAKATLCDCDKRRDYDRWRLSGMAMRYEEWCSRKDSMHTSLHWAVRKQKEPMLEGKSDPHEGCDSNNSQQEHCAPQGWQRNSSSDVLNKFRNYQI